MRKVRYIIESDWTSYSSLKAPFQLLNVLGNLIFDLKASSLAIQRLENNAYTTFRLRVNAGSQLEPAVNADIFEEVRRLIHNFQG